MCGICGIYDTNGRPVSQDLLRRMNGTMVHRGPDDEGYHIDKNIGLGHRRLSIIDLHTGHQPIFNEDKSKVIVFNGEIYNFLQLREELENEGHRFKTRTDTEVILHGYEEWGKDCVNRLRGMFAFAIWDRDERTLFLARDRLGIKPLYYYADGSMFIFASELKAILQEGNIAAEIDPQALSDYLSFGYIPAPKTIFRGVSKLLPGHVLIFKEGNLNLRQYWDLRFQSENEKPIDQFCDQILDTLRESIQMRLISDVPLGAFLSGGIDSSAVVAIMASLMAQAVITNSIGFTERKYSELDYAGRTANLFNTEHHEYVVSPDAVEVVNKLSLYFDEPFADSSSIPTYYVSKMARDNVTVALSGDGGDENFLGYRRYYFDQLENQLRSVIPHGLRAYLLGALARLYPKADWLPQVLRGKAFLTNVSQDNIRAHFNTVSLFLPTMKQKIMSPEFKANLKGYDSIEVLRTYYTKYDEIGCDDFLSRIQYVDFKTYLVDDILTKVDRASMANSLEVRVPMLDHKFLEMVATIPSHLKLKGRESKYILKKSLMKLLPADVIQRKKMGFSVPIGDWMRNELREMAEELLFDESLGSNVLFDMTYIRSLWKQHLSGLRNFSEQLWVLICFQLWAKRFISG